MSVNVGGRTLYLYRLGDAATWRRSNAPTELAFSERYGRIERHHWFGDGYLLVGFETGQVVLLSTENDEQQEELSALRLFGESRDDARDEVLPGDASRRRRASGRSVKLVDVVDGRLEEVSAETLEFDANNATVTCLGWALEGQVLTVGTGDGHCYSFLASLPNLSGRTIRVWRISPRSPRCPSRISPRARCAPSPSTPSPRFWRSARRTSPRG